ncbi:MAG: hypothetical protein V3U79_06730 [Dehalococcoidia bacterium]
MAALNTTSVQGSYGHHPIYFSGHIALINERDVGEPTFIYYSGVSRHFIKP